MKKKDILTALLLLGSTVQAQNWPEIKPEARPGSRWWWMGSAVDQKGLAYNLHKYGTAGIGSLEITPIYGVKGNEQRDIPFLSSRWMEMYQYTQDEAQKNGIDIDMNTGTGWPFGGPEITLEHAATRAIFEQYTVTGGKKIEQQIEITSPKEQKQREFAQLSRLMAYAEDGTCLNLTSKVKNGKLEWNAPKGKWKLIALFVGKTLQKVKRAAPGGEGYVMDHMNPEAVKGYFTKFDRAFKQNKATYPRTFFNDSYEVYKADWTPHLLEEFERRRGYKLEEHFPEFLDASRPEATRRIVSDYRETVSEMLIDNFTTQWTKWAHKHGSTTRNQAHGSPANLIDTYASVDIPECEGFGLTDFHIKGLRKDSLTRPNFSDISMLKYASSAAHIAGKPYTSSETFTWLTEHFRTSLSQCKPDMDLMFVSGVNHMFFHGTPYSPQDAAWPGWLFYASINMSPTNSIWRDAPAFFEYITRCQSFLQMGQPDNDFLVYLPIYDLWDELPGRLVSFDIHKMDRYAPKFIKTIQTIIAGGYDVDYISDAFIKTTRCADNQLVTSGGTHYKALIVPAARLMPAATLRFLYTYTDIHTRKRTHHRRLRLSAGTGTDGNSLRRVENTMWTSVYPPLESRRASLFCFVSTKQRYRRMGYTECSRNDCHVLQSDERRKRQGTKPDRKREIAGPSATEIGGKPHHSDIRQVTGRRTSVELSQRTDIQSESRPWMETRIRGKHTDHKRSV